MTGLLTTTVPFWNRGPR